MKYQKGVKTVEGAKVDGKRFLLLVRWDDDEREFVPHQVRSLFVFSQYFFYWALMMVRYQIVNKLAPKKVISFYESRLQVRVFPGVS